MRPERDGPPPSPEPAEARERRPELAAFPFFEGAAAAAARLSEAGSWRVYAPGEAILDFEERSTDVFFVATGAVRVLLRSAGGRDIVLSELGAGSLFGEMAAIDGAPRSANVTAVVLTRVCRVPAALFMEVVCACPPVCRRLLRTLVARLRGQNERLLERATLPVHLRLCAELLRLSRERPGEASGERLISPPPPQHLLASRIGASREVVSAEFAKLVRRGLVERTPRAILLKAPETLRREIDAELRPVLVG